MNMFKAGVSVFACLFVLLVNPFVSVVSAAVPGVPHSADSMWLEPALVELSSDTVSLGYRFNVTVWINLTVNSASWQFKLAYNKNHLNATQSGYTAGGKSDFFSNITTLPLSTQFGSLNATHNYVLSAETWMLGLTRSPGYGSLAWIEFEVVAVPPSGETYTSQIGMVDVYPAGTETYAQQPNSAKVPLSTYDTTYRLSTPGGPPPPFSGTMLYVDPENITDPTLGPSSTFTINITVMNVSDMKICEFNLTYDPMVLGCIGINFLKVQGQYPTPQVVYDDEAGFMWVKLEYSPAVTTENSALIGLIFHVESYGISVLDLHDTNLTDSNGDPIDHESKDGLFITIIRDVAVTNVSVSRDWTFVGIPINITVHVKNVGNLNETFTVTAYYDLVEIANQTITDLQPEQEATLVFPWDARHTMLCRNYTISAKASLVPFELNTTNNEYINGQVRIRLLGDLNNDGKVRVDDVYIVASAFGSEPGHPRWNPEADVNGDGKVRVDDIFLVASNFGAECAP